MAWSQAIRLMAGLLLLLLLRLLYGSASLVISV